MDDEEVAILRSEKDIEMVVPSGEIVALPIGSGLICNSICAFSTQENNHLESEERSKSSTKLWGLIVFYIIVMVVEVVGGLKANSLAVLTDAAHLLIDVAGFSASLFAVWASGWKETSHQSYGFSRLEVLGALLSVQLVWLISGLLTYEAVDRLLHKNARVNGALMFAIAAFGFIVNLIMVVWLGHDHSHNSCHNHHHHEKNIHDHDEHDICSENGEEVTKLVSSSHDKGKTLNINIQGAYVHVMADMIQSLGVMIAGVIVWAKPDWLIVDLICSLIFSVFVLLSTVPMLRDIFVILMEGTPREINIRDLENGLKDIKGVQDVHDLHVWAMTIGKLALSCHVVADAGTSSAEILNRVRNYCELKHGVRHITVQIEQ